jgi:hypothetical protein
MTGFGKTDRIGRRRQAATTLTNQAFQTKFHSLPVEQDHRTRIPCRLRAWYQIQGFDQRLGGFVKRAGIKIDFEIAAVVPGSLGGLVLWLRSREFG